MLEVVPQTDPTCDNGYNATIATATVTYNDSFIACNPSKSLQA